MQKKSKQPQNAKIVRDLPKNTHRDAAFEKSLVEVNMKIKSFQDTCVRIGNICTVEAGNKDNLIQNIKNEYSPSNTKDFRLKSGCRKEDDVLNDHSNLLSTCSDTGRNLPFFFYISFFHFLKK